MILLIIAAFIFIGYIATITYLYGWLPSISESFYRLPVKFNWIFSTFLWIISINMMYAGGTNLMFLAGFFIMFVGVFPYFNETRWQHYISALLGIGFGMASLWVNFNQWPLVLLFIIIGLFLIVSKVKNLYFWIEIIAFNIIIYGLIQEKY
jgi:hypothetical protein